jgi:hypothetical protein
MRGHGIVRLRGKLVVSIQSDFFQQFAAHAFTP